jgi:hypothetical protein
LYVVLHESPSFDGQVIGQTGSEEPPTLALDLEYSFWIS